MLRSRRVYMLSFRARGVQQDGSNETEIDSESCWRSALRGSQSLDRLSARHQSPIPQRHVVGRRCSRRTLFSPDLNVPAPRLRFRKGRHACALCSDFVCAVCAPGDQMRYKRVQSGLVGVHTPGLCSCCSPLKVQDKHLEYRDYRFSVAPMMDWSESSSFSIS